MQNQFHNVIIRRGVQHKTWSYFDRIVEGETFDIIFKLRIFDLSEFIVWNIKDLRQRKLEN